MELVSQIWISVWVARNPPGYAFIEFAKRREADDAISSLDGECNFLCKYLFGLCYFLHAMLAL